MIFLNHQCYCHLGIPRIVSAKYEVILRLATMFFCWTSLIEKKKEKKETKKQFQIGFRAIAQKPFKKSNPLQLLKGLELRSKKNWEQETG